MTPIPTHHHGGGKEFLVLEGVFSDEHGDDGPGSYGRHPAGTWLRHPADSRHAPFSQGGYLIWVMTDHLARSING